MESVRGVCRALMDGSADWECADGEPGVNVVKGVSEEVNELSTDLQIFLSVNQISSSG